MLSLSLFHCHFRWGRSRLYLLAVYTVWIFSAFVVWATFYLCLMSHFISFNMCALSILMILACCMSFLFLFLFYFIFCIYFGVHVFSRSNIVAVCPNEQRMVWYGKRWMYAVLLSSTSNYRALNIDAPVLIPFFLFLFRRIYKGNFFNAMMNLFFCFFYFQFHHPFFVSVWLMLHCYGYTTLVRCIVSPCSLLSLLFLFPFSTVDVLLLVFFLIALIFL